MKVLINDQEKDLIPYKGNPQQWWDGTDETKVFSFGDLRFPTTSQAVAQTVSRLTIKAGVRGSVSKIPKTKPKASKKPCKKV